jgi:hypothetical protein
MSDNTGFEGCEATVLPVLGSSGEAGQRLWEAHRWWLPPDIGPSVVKRRRIHWRHSCTRAGRQRGSLQVVRGAKKQKRIDQKSEEEWNHQRRSMMDLSLYISRLRESVSVVWTRT